MCIVIDTNTFSSVFSPTSERHEEFKPVLDWILNGKGKIVFGGTKYLAELKKCRETYIKITAELSRYNKVVNIDSTKVDKYEAELQKAMGRTDCDDQHIIAIISVSTCKLICSLDVRAYKHFKNKSWYPVNVSRPRIYTGKRNISLLSGNYCPDICK